MIEDDVDPLRTPLLGPSPEEDVGLEIEDETSPAVQDSALSTTNDESDEDDDEGSIEPCWHRVLYSQLFSDDGFSREWTILEGSSSIKLFKFTLLTFFSIGGLHWLVSNLRAHHRDARLTIRDLIIFDGGLIMRDIVIFFLVGRLWQQRGVDHGLWVGIIVLTNLYFESLHYIPLARHSVSLYEMHCAWPWELWIAFGVLACAFGSIVVCHVRHAYKEKILWMRLIEVILCLFFFLVPSIMHSPGNFHFHRWFAGWLLGMHSNLNVWWSQAAMAYSWGMYINGVAVYGRDPVLTCEYAQFLTWDQGCPFVYEESCSLAQQLGQLFSNALPHVSLHDAEPEPADWRNCSSKGYHP